jgi:WS/DGAT/MGAT family acyltransferase
MDADSAFPRHVSGADELMWRIEADPVLRSPILVVGLLDREPADRDARAALECWQSRLPRLRQRLLAAPRILGGARWVDSDDATLDFHVRHVRAPHPADLGAVLAVAEPTVTAPFDVARPLWEFTLVDGLAGGRAAFALRFHHAVTDGVGGVELASQLFDRSRTVRRRTAGAPAHAPTRAGPVVSAARLAAGVGRLGLNVTRHPVGTVGNARRLGRSLARALAPGEPGSPAFHRRGLDRRLDVLEVPLAALQRVADGIGCTLNDVFLAAIGGALRDYHDRIGHRVAVLQCTMPINLRGEHDPRGGNRFAPARFALPIDDPDPAARARIAGAIVRQWRSEPALPWTGVVSAALDFLPGPLVVRLLGAMLKEVDVDAVNVPGPRRAAYFAGARLDRLWAFAPPTGAALSVTLLSYVDTCCIGLTCDRQAVPEPELVRSCLESSIEQVLALGAPATSSRRPA